MSDVLILYFSADRVTAGGNIFMLIVGMLGGEGGVEAQIMSH